MYPSTQDIIDLALQMLTSHYCNNDVQSILPLLDSDVIWIGTGEEEFARGQEQVTQLFGAFAGTIPPCNLSGLESQVMQLTPELWLYTGRVWISTDASTQFALRVHQRITFLFRLQEGQLRCCHIHVSNPYEDMREGDQGFPFQMAKQSSQYLQEQIELQKQQIAQQTALLERLSYEDGLTGAYNRNRYNQLLATGWDQTIQQLGVACIDLNGLKRTNDLMGHKAGDELLCRMARQLQQAFEGKVYRVGGDEFAVIDSEQDRQSFQAAIQAVQKSLAEDGISCSVGTSWRAAPCSLQAQLDEADSRMYWDKRQYYDAMTASPYHPYHD